MNLALPTGPLAQAIGWALLHLLWQGAVVAALLATLLTFLSGRSASLRYAISCAALALIVALGVATAIRSYPAATGAAAGTSLAPTADPSTAVAAVAPARPDPARALVHAANESLPKIVTFWLAGVALFSVRLILEWLRARRLATRSASRAREHWQAAARRLSLAMGVRHAVRVLESAAVEVPSVIGLVRPAILLPASALTGLTPAQLEMILAHELAHIRRHDFLVNLLQAVVETLLFYHPAVWWISRQVRIERENCCDDLAVAVCGDPLQYARALTRLEELRAPALPLAVSANGGSLFERIRRIAGGSTHATGPAVRGAAALAMLSCVLVAIAAPSFPAIGEWEPDMRHGRHHASAAATQAARDTSPRTSTDENPGPDLGDFTDDVPAMRPIVPSTSVWGSDTAPEAPAAIPDDDPNADAEPEPDLVPNGGRSGLSLDEVIELRTQDVTPAEIREMRSLFPGIDMSEIAQLKAVGVTPQFIREMRSAGLAVESAQDAQGLTALGVTSEFIREMRSAGLAVESAQDAQGLAALGVTPDYVRELRNAGVEIADASDVQALRAMDVTPEFVRRLANAGYRHLTVSQLTRLAASGVTGDFVREMSKYKSR